MKNRYLLTSATLFILMICIIACSIAPQASEPTETSTAQTVLYVCDLNDENHTKILTAEVCQWSAQNIVYPQYGQTPIDYEYTLSGDIQGTEYNFNLWLASGKTTTVDAQIVLRQGESETVLASATFTADEQDFKVFSQTVDGSDPATSRGDILILRVIPTSGKDGAILYTGDKSRTSFIGVPPIK